MAKPQSLIGVTQILAAIYNPEHLPSAIIAAGSGEPYCLHSFRESDLQLFEKRFMPTLRVNNGVRAEDRSMDEKLEAFFYKFYEDYPDGGHSCHGCYHSEQIENTHRIRESEEACTKTTEECA